MVCIGRIYKYFPSQVMVARHKEPRSAAIRPQNCIFQASLGYFLRGRQTMCANFVAFGAVMRLEASDGSENLAHYRVGAGRFCQLEGDGACCYARSLTE
jgi:hypothetical protein